MKKMMLLGFSLFVGSVVYGAPPVAEAPVKSYGTPVTIAISSTTLTQVPSSQTSGRIGIFFDNPFTNTGRIVGFYGNCTSTALANTIRPFEIAAGNNSSFIPMREDVCLWLLDTNTAAASENVHYQEVIQ